MVKTPFLLLAILFGLVGRLTAQTPAPADPALSYTLTPADRIRVEVYQEEDLKVIRRIDPKGMVNLPLVGEVRIAGSTVRDAQSQIELAYRDGRFLRAPQVTITVEEYAPREVTVTGEVKAGGRFPMPIETRMTVMDAIARAGGLTDTARGTAVSVTRILADGTKRTFTVDVESMIKGRDRASVKDSVFVLEPGDIVYVPQRII
jgi:polysaccharide biosynthesis/export protein